MSEYRFSLVVPAGPLTHIQILDATDALGKSGCTDASVRGHSEGMELLFERSAESLQAAITSAISDVESAGYRVGKVEMEREAIPV
jgi:hypothetical protein